MDLSGTAPIGSSAHQGLLNRTGSSVQAMGGAGSFDPIAAFGTSTSHRGGSNSQALVSLGYGGVAESGSDGGNVQAMLATLGGGNPTFNLPEGLPASGAALSLGMAGYTSGPPQNPHSAAAQGAVASIQQFLATSGLNLLA